MSASTSAHAERVAFDASTVSLEPGVSLVEASAGTGKTFSIMQLVLRLLLSKTEDNAYRVRGIGSILVVTFTNAATDELITRVRRELRRATDVFAGGVTETPENEALFDLRREYGDTELPRLREALASLDQLAIFTIHGFCRRVLEESALESGTPFGARFIEDDALIVQRIAQDWWRRTMYEDADLATLAVHLDWQHDAFLKDLKMWQRLPGTRLDPHDTMYSARKALSAAIQRFAKSWDSARAASFLEERKWLASSPLKDSAARQETVRAGDELLRGSLHHAIILAERCGSEAMLGAMYKKPAAMREAVAVEPFVQACDALANALHGIELALRVACLEDVHRRFDEEKRRRHLLGFDDLLRRLHTALTSEGSEGHLATAIRSRYDAALIDEFQDTDPYQFPIFSTAFAGRPLFLIGDPKQAIFAFRGADLFAYMDAAGHAERGYTLGRNWRSTDRMVRAVNALFSYRPNAFLYHRIGFSAAQAARDLVDPLLADGRGALHWWLLPPTSGSNGATMLSKGEATKLVHEALVGEIVALLTPSPERSALRPNQLAVLVRAGYEGIAVQKVLRAAGVPSIVSGMDDILKSRELGELEMVLRAVLEPTDARSVRAALATELWGMQAAGIHRLALPEHESEWEGIIDTLVVWRDEWLRRGVMRVTQAILSHLQATERLLARGDGERRVTNLRHAVELLHTAALEEQLSPEGLLLWLSRTRASGEEKAERTELRLESDALAVQIVTIHKSKGREYDVVFCPTLWSARRTAEDTAVLVHESGTVVLDHGSPTRADRGRLYAAEELAEELRLVYVALTRARFRCYVAWGAVDNKKTRIHAGYAGLGYLLRDSDAAGEPEERAEAVPRAFAASPSSFVEAVDALVRAHPGLMTSEQLVSRFDGAARVAPRWASAAAPVDAPAWRTDLPAPDSLRSWRAASFTSLTAGHHVDDARDVSDAGEGPAERPMGLAPLDFTAFPAGRLPGIALHELFERADFDAPPAELSLIAAEILQRTRLLDHPDRVQAVVTMAERVLGSPLPAAGFALRDVPRDHTLREWSFDLPLGTVERATFATLFATHGGDLARRYAPALQRLAVERVHGFLTGVMDLACEHGGQWFVVDWKSNHLGVDPASYEPAALEREMFGSHYVLQYHLYLTALHRFLAVRQPGYDYDTHLGGAWYAFLRGVDGTERGWFHDRPPRALIEALSNLMDGVQT